MLSFGGGTASGGRNRSLKLKGRACFEYLSRWAPRVSGLNLMKAALAVAVLLTLVVTVAHLVTGPAESRNFLPPLGGAQHLTAPRNSASAAPASGVPSDDVSGQHRLSGGGDSGDTRNSTAGSAEPLAADRSVAAGAASGSSTAATGADSSAAEPKPGAPKRPAWTRPGRPRMDLAPMSTFVHNDALPTRVVWPARGQPPPAGLGPYMKEALDAVEDALEDAARLPTGSAADLAKRLGECTGRNIPGLGSCAVVGNARSLLGSGHGAEIDAHDVVIRLNQAPVRGFEQDVGGRSDVRLVHDVRAFDGTGAVKLFPPDRDGRTEVTICRVWPGTSSYAADKAARLGRAALRGDECGVFMMSPDIEHAAYRLLWSFEMDPAKERIGGSKASTGLVALVAALSMCSGRVVAYGFNAADYQRTEVASDDTIHNPHIPLLQSGRYFDPAGLTYSAPHAFGRESEALRRIAEANPRLSIMSPVPHAGPPASNRR